jgi:hypothetical protein
MQYAGNLAALSSLNATLFKEKTKGRLMDTSVSCHIFGQTSV